jgi:hypothetical protein
LLSAAALMAEPFGMLTAIVLSEKRPQDNTVHVIITSPAILFLP